MDTRTGEIKDLLDIKAEEKKHFVPLTAQQARKLKKFPAERRVDLLKAMNDLKSRRAKNKAARKARKRNRRC